MLQAVDLSLSDDTVDHIQVASKMLPEPSSLMLFGSRFGIAVVLLPRPNRLVTHV